VDASIPDLLRLVAVPIFGWAAVSDLEDRRVSGKYWPPLIFLGSILIFWEALISLGTPGAFRVYVIRVSVSLFFLFVLAFIFRQIGEFGMADVWALRVIAILLPIYPYYEIFGMGLPSVQTALGVFSMTVLTNAVLLGLLYPAFLGIQNLTKGEISLVMFVGKRTPVSELPDIHGRLLESPSGFERKHLDLDALRMYLRWRGIDLEDLLTNPDLKDPDTLPDDPNEPTDGVIRTDGGSDPWGAAAFLEDIDGSAYGTSPEMLREALDLITSQDEVWVTPGSPFLVFIFLGLIVGLTGGDILYLILGLLGLAPV